MSKSKSTMKNTSNSAVVSAIVFLILAFFSFAACVRLVSEGWGWTLIWSGLLLCVVAGACLWGIKDKSDW